MKKALLLALATVLGVAANAQQVLINEFVANHVGTDTNEYIELYSSPNTNLAGLTVLHIEGDTTGAGLIDSFYNAGTTNAGGFWMTPYLNNGLENGSISLLLVSGFTAGVGTDLDTNNDGVFDITPWAAILDAVAVSDGGVGDFTYGGVTLTPSHPGGALTVGGASRIPNGLDTNAVGDWMRNDFDGAGIPGLGAGTPVVGEAYNTPNATNSPVPEPTSIAALGVGALALLRRRKKSA